MRGDQLHFLEIIFSVLEGKTEKCCDYLPFLRTKFISDTEEAVSSKQREEKDML